MSQEEIENYLEKFLQTMCSYTLMYFILMAINNFKLSSAHNEWVVMN